LDLFHFLVGYLFPSISVGMLNILPTITLRNYQDGDTQNLTLERLLLHSSDNIHL